MSHIPKLLSAVGRLLSYPDETSVQAAELVYIVLQGELTDAAKGASAFGAFVEQHESWEVEEAFTRTFDVNPSCALEVGWHLFGEEYMRGMFLVRMREELRKYGLRESQELPDHVSHVLAVVAAMPDDEAARFVRACVLPAVQKMNRAISEKETPYRHIIACLFAILRHVWGDPDDTDGDSTQSNFDRSLPFASDPLRAYPVADVGCACDTQCRPDGELVPLQIHLSPHDERTENTTRAQTRES